VKKLLSLALCLLLLTGCATPKAAGEGYTFTDDTGTEVIVPEKPETVAVLLSSLADLWLTAGGTVDITVGETVERGFAGETAILVDEGAGKTVNLEALVAAEPDFVIYSADLSGQLECAEMLRAAGIPAAGFHVETFEDYLRVLKICTDILGTPERYARYGTDLKAEIDGMIAEAREAPVSVLFVRAGSSAKYTKAKTAENHFVCAMLKELGTFNIAEKAPILLDGLSTEEILISDPDFILFTTMGDESAGQAYMESLVSDPVWKTLTAVKTGRVYQLPKELFQFKPNARWAEAYRYLIELLYGDTL
jgi:iron complex transport system substrate-binding protein